MFKYHFLRGVLSQEYSIFIFLLGDKVAKLMNIPQNLIPMTVKHSLNSQELYYRK